MKAEESKSLIKKLGGLFPTQLTTEQARMLAAEFRPLAAAAVEKAIREHRADPDLKDGFLHVGKLLALCRATERAQDMEEKLNTANEGSRADIIRRQWPQLAGVRDDREVYLRASRREWFEFRDRTGLYTEKYLEAVAGRLRENCAWHLQQAGMDAASAKSWAEAIFVEPDHFRTCLAELRGELAAMPSEASA